MMTSVMIWRSRYQSAGSLKTRMASMGLLEEPYPRFLMGHTPGAPACCCSEPGGPKSDMGSTDPLLVYIWHCNWDLVVAAGDSCDSWSRVRSFGSTVSSESAKLMRKVWRLDRARCSYCFLLENLISCEAHAEQTLAWSVFPEGGSAWECSCHISRGECVLKAIVLRHFRHLANPSNHDRLIPQLGYQALEGRVGQHHLQPATPQRTREQQ